MSRSTRTRAAAAGVPAILAVLATAGAAAGPAGARPEPVVQPYLDLGGLAAPVAGRPVRAVPGVWTSGGLTFRVTWQSCAAGTLNCATVPGAGGPTYTPTDADAGRTLRARVEAIGAPGAGEAWTAATAPVERDTAAIPGAPAAAAPPVGTEDPVLPPTGVSGPAQAAVDPTPRRADRLPARLVRPFGALLLLRSPDTGGTLAVRDPSGRVVAAAGGTGAPGLLAVRLTRAGRWVVIQDGVERRIEVVLRPVVALTRAPRTVVAPASFVVEGWITPGAGRKLVQLQYLDPGRGWRLWTQSQTEEGGRFRLARVLPRNPRAPRYRLRYRVVVPADRGWPFAPGTSAPVVAMIR